MAFSKSQSAIARLARFDFVLQSEHEIKNRPKTKDSPGAAGRYFQENAGQQKNKTGFVSGHVLPKS